MSAPATSRVAGPITPVQAFGASYGCGPSMPDQLSASMTAAVISAVPTSTSAGKSERGGR